VHPKARFASIVVAASTLSLVAGLTNAAAEDAVFDFRVDRFEITGQTVSAKSPGPFVEEFDAGLGNWIEQYGTAFTADGFLHLTNPGTPVPNGFGVLPGRTLDLSLVGSSPQVFDGSGDFVARSYWVPDELAPGDFNHMSLNTLGPAPQEIAGLAITNVTPEGAPTVYTIVQHLVRLGAGAPELTSYTFDPAAITGQIVFELRFTDDTNTLETAFSLDGGVTFEQPFPPLHIFQGTFYGYFLLGADPLAGTVRTEMPGPPLCKSGKEIVDASVVPTAKAGATIALKGTMKGPLRGYDPRRLGAQIRIVDRSLPQMPVLDLTSTSALPGNPGCGRRDGWHPTGSGVVYRNETNALPPACIPGSAEGLTRLRLKKVAQRLKGRVLPPDLAYEVDLATSWRPVSGARVSTTIVLGDGASASTPCGTVETSCSATAPEVCCEQSAGVAGKRPARVAGPCQLRRER
jgi:hypothetical protein